MAARRRNPIAVVGNYAAPVDAEGMDESMRSMMMGTKMDKTETNYLKSARNKKSATEAVRRARRANRAAPLKEIE